MHQIRYFLAVCDSKNFTRAARVSFVSQPSLTQAIQRLEDELGGSLFSRGRTGAELTTLGKLVESNLRAIYETSLNTKEKAVRFQRLKKEPVSVGVMHSIGTRKLNPFFAHYQKESPRVELEIVIDSLEVLLEKWREGELDCVICSAPPNIEDKTRFEPLYTENYVVALPRGHALAKKSRLTLRELQSEPYLDRLNCEMRETLKEKLSAQDIQLYATYRSNREEWLIDMVREGIGFAILPEFTVPKSEGILAKPLAEPAIQREVGVLLKRIPNQSASKHFLEQLTHYFRAN